MAFLLSRIRDGGRLDSQTFGTEKVGHDQGVEAGIYLFQGVEVMLWIK